MQIKSDKGVVGTDFVIAIMILVLFVTIATTIFYQISRTNVETKRQSVVTNGTVNILEKIAAMPYDEFEQITDFEEWYKKQTDIRLPEGYTVSIQKTNTEKEELLTEVEVSVSYPVQGETKELTIKTLKTR